MGVTVDVVVLVVGDAVEEVVADIVVEVLVTIAGSSVGASACVGVADVHPAMSNSGAVIQVSLCRPMGLTLPGYVTNLASARRWPRQKRTWWCGRRDSNPHEH